MSRVFNFSAGPSMLPQPVLEKVQQEMLSYRSSGSSIMEMSHRSSLFNEVISQAQSNLRSLMNIPSEYAVLFVHGGATMQFSTVAYNLAKQGDTADYVITGEFAQKAFSEAGRWLKAVPIASSSDKNFTYIPKITPEIGSDNAKYLHITVNNTIFGTMYNEIPQRKSPIVADMSSIILGKEYDVSQFGVIYAGAQKNIGCAGLAVVIVKRSLLGNAEPLVPSLLNYEMLEKASSMVNTPATFSIYVSNLVFEWLKSMGGVKAMQAVNEQKAKLLYDAIENSKIYHCPTVFEDRSIMNIPFTLPSEQQTEDFLKFSQSRGLMALQGHRSVGGIRASIYNAMPLEGVKSLISCMKDFEYQQKV
ncbi:MAG: 3-phosphoserine/phosphohydroxythreonine transaminase [Brevinema sp.]